MNTKKSAIGGKNAKIFIFSIMTVAMLFFFCGVKNSHASVCGDNCIKEYCTGTSTGMAPSVACNNGYGPCVTACAREADTSGPSGNTSVGGSTCGNTCKITWQDNCTVDSSTCDKNYSDCLAVCYKNSGSSISPGTPGVSTESVKITKNVTVEGTTIKAISIVSSDGSVIGATNLPAESVNYNSVKAAVSGGGSTSSGSTESITITKDVVVGGKTIQAGSVVHSDGSVTGTSASVSPVNYSYVKAAVNGGGSTSEGSTQSIKITKDVTIEGKLIKAGSIIHSDGSITGNTTGSISDYNAAKQVAIAANATTAAAPGSEITGLNCEEEGFVEGAGGVCYPITTLPDPTGPNGGIFEILSNLLSWLLGLFGIFAVMAFVISGIQYLTSAGDQDMLEKAKRNAQYSLIGVVVGLSGFVIIKAIDAAMRVQGLF